MVFSAYYSILVGATILLMWAFLILSGQVPNLEAELPNLLFHWTAELGTAVLLVVGGVGLLSRARWAGRVQPLAMGALLYSLVNSPGFYALRGEWGMVAMFAILFALALLSLFLRHGTSRGQTRGRRLTAERAKIGAEQPGPEV